MEVVFDQLFDDNNGSNGSAPFNANHFSFGISTPTTSSNYLNTNGAVPASEGLGVSLTDRNGVVDIGLLEADLSAGTTATLDPFTSSTVGVGQVFTITVDESGNYDWSLNGETGSVTTSLDLTRAFQFVTRTQVRQETEFKASQSLQLGSVYQEMLTRIAVNFLDVSPFIGLLSSGAFQCEADCNSSGTVDFLDISPFIGILSGA